MDVKRDRDEDAAMLEITSDDVESLAAQSRELRTRARDLHARGQQLRQLSTTLIERAQGSRRDDV